MQERIIPSSAQELCASPIKEKRLGRFSPPDLQSNSEQRKIGSNGALRGVPAGRGSAQRSAREGKTFPLY